MRDIPYTYPLSAVIAYTLKLAVRYPLPVLSMKRSFDYFREEYICLTNCVRDTTSSFLPFSLFSKLPCYLELLVHHYNSTASLPVIHFVSDIPTVNIGE